MSHTEHGTTPQNSHHGHCDDLRPHAPRRVLDKESGLLHDLRWDDAGNLGQASMSDGDGRLEKSRFLFWTEDSRLHTVVDDRYHSYYAYDHAGERTLKIAGPCDALDVSAWVMHSHSPLQKFTLYPSPYVVVSDHGYTKHYYAGTERLAARVGGGFGKAVLHEQQEGITRQARDLFHQSLGSIQARRPLAAPEISQEEHLEDAVYSRMADHIHVPEILEAHVEIKNRDFLQSMRDLVADAPEPDVYFYHSDHLGSASWITDANGEAVQHLQYLPYGEPYINQRNNYNDYNERFTFTGKERDEETGFGYFGARYMDHELMTGWLSVDPFSDKYPSISPYAYCAWNPIKLVDPDGRDWYVPEGQSTPVYDKKITEKNCPKGARYVGRTACWGGQHEYDMQYRFKGDENGNLTCTNMETMENATLTYASCTKNRLSDYSTAVLLDNMFASGMTDVQITSTSRSPEDQARIMRDNCRDGNNIGYAAPGRAVVSKYNKYASDIDNYHAMLAEIYKQGPSKVSLHCGVWDDKNVFDIKKTGKSRAFDVQLYKDSRIRYLSPYDPKVKETCHHIEIKQPK